MIVKTVTVLLMLGAALATKPFEGVDPNTLTCDPAGQVFLLLPHWSDCSIFFMCTHGREVQFHCSAPLIFDFELQGCNWERDAQCILRNPPSEEDEDIEGSGEESGDFEWSSFNENLPQAEPVGAIATIDGVVRTVQHTAEVKHFNAIIDCSRAESSARQLPFKGDCQRYWRCVNGLAESVYCSDGLFFNERTMQCDFESNVRCDVNHEYELEGEFMVYK